MIKKSCRKKQLEFESIVGDSFTSNCIIMFCFLFSFFDSYKSQECSLKLQSEAKQHLSFENLVYHLGHLVTGHASIAHATKKELQCHLAEKESLVQSVEYRKTPDELDLNIWKDISVFVPFDHLGE